jgi:uncharacterized protein (DUF1330 family)
MAKGYWIGRVDVTNEEGFKPYAAANPAIFKKFGGRYLVRGGKFDAAEETPARAGLIYFEDEPGRRSAAGRRSKKKAPGNRPGSEFSLRTFPTVRRKNSSSKYNVRVAPLMLWRLPTGDPLDLDKN